MGEDRGTHLHDLPEDQLSNIFGLVDDTRSRNSMALVCHRWRQLERTTRTFITLRGNVRHLFRLPTCFPSVTHLDISLLSPWGYSFLHPHHQLHHHHAEYDDLIQLPDHVVACCLRRAFPLVTSLTVYVRTTSTIQALAPQWPELRHVKLVRWHQRPPSPPGSDFAPLLRDCSSLSSLDLSNFYCWTEDLPAALQIQPSRSLTRLDLLSLSSVGGFKSHELLAICSACPALRHLLVPCAFDPRHHGFIGDEVLLKLASNCKELSTLHLIDHSTLSAPRTNYNQEDWVNSEDARISQMGLENLFAFLPMLEDLVLDVCYSIRETGSAVETLNHRCPRIRSLKLGQFHGVCRATALHLDGVAVCGGLTSLSLKNSSDLTDASLIAIGRGCSKLSKFEIHGCDMISESGLMKMANTLRATLVDVSISCCKRLDAPRALRALEPIRDRIHRLHIDCIWSLDVEELNGEDRVFSTFLDEHEEDIIAECSSSSSNAKENGNGSKNKRRRLSEGITIFASDDVSMEMSGFYSRTWKQLRYLSVWVPVGEELTPLPSFGLENCPELEEMCIKVDGDCRLCPLPVPNQAFGLMSLLHYPRLAKLKLDCGDVIGYVLTAPMGQMDLSSWERFYLNGIKELNLAEFDYWPPQDKDMNQRSLSLPAVGLLAECATLRKLFIHGTANEHFIRFLLNIPNLRDVQLIEDYYPAPESDTSTEMRVDSWSRFEDALNRRPIPD